VIDDYTRFKAVVPVKTKVLAKEAVMTLVSRWENQTGHIVKVIRSDNGLEYTGTAWSAWTAAKGIQHHTTTRYTPQSNGVAERYNGVVVELTVAALAGCDLDLKFWGEAAVTINYLGNRVVGRGRTATPCEMLYGARPDVSHLCPFGCRAWVHVPDELRKKMQPRAVLGTFVGYGIDQRGYRVLVGNRIETSRDVRFDEPRVLGPGALTTTSSDLTEDDTVAPVVHFPDDLDAVAPRARAPSPSVNAPTPTPGPLPPGAATPAVPLSSVDDAVAAALRLVGGASAAIDGGAASVTEDSAAGEDAGASTPDSSASEPSDTDTVEPGSGTDMSAAGDRDSVGGSGPVAGFRHPARLLRPNSRPAQARVAWALAASGGRFRDKMRIEQARREPDWPEFDAAVQREVDSLWAHGTWYLTDRPAGKTVTDTDIIFERKRGPDGELASHKGRFVGRGDKQTYMVDYTDVWTPVARYSTLRALLAYCAVGGLHVYQLDIETAFLNGEVDEEIYIRQPRGYERGDPCKVCRIVKALYGLKQAARAWHKKLDSMLEAAGFTP